MITTDTLGSDVSVATPIDPSMRIDSLDILRGFAVLGILMMNIQMFSMPDMAYFNPNTYGDLTGPNYLVWIVSHVFFDMKFMTLFSMLFGAGIVLFCTHAQARGHSTARLHYRRTLWLLLFGLLHAYLLWNGDILTWYAMSALIAYGFWRLRPLWLIVWSLLLLAVGTGMYLLISLAMPYIPPEALAEMSQTWDPNSAAFAAQLATYRGGWSGIFLMRLPQMLAFHTIVFFLFAVWRVLGLMLLGMALYKLGFLSAQRSYRTYLILILMGVAGGLSLIIYGVNQNSAHDWAFEYSFFVGLIPNYWGSIPMAIAYASAFMIINRRGTLLWLTHRLAQVGRMAFTNYLAQTLICTTLFYGYGFGLYGYVPRWGQSLIVFSVWILLLIFSNWWLSRFQFGPLEWLWRSLTYRNAQPMRLRPLPQSFESAESTQ